MARVRIPNLPGVGSAPGLTGIDPSAASAPGRAATEMFMELGNMVTRNEIRHKEDIKKGKAEIAAQNAKANKQLKDALAEQQNLIKQRWAVVQRNREEVYTSKFNIAKGNIATDLRVATSQFSNEAATANPDEIMDIQKNYKDLVSSQFEERIKGLRPADITALRTAHENNMRVFDVTAASTQDTRTLQLELDTAKLDLETYLYVDTPDAQEQVASAIEVYKRHYKDHWETELRKVQGPALYSSLFNKAQQADTPDKITALMEEVDKNGDLLKGTYRYNLTTLLNKNAEVYERDILILKNKLARAAMNGEVMDEDLLKEYVAAGKITQEEADGWVAEAGLVRTDKNAKNIFTTWKSNNWNAYDNYLRDKYADIFDQTDPKVTISNLKALEKEINDYHESPLVKNFIKSQVIAQVAQSTADVDFSWSTHMGEQIDEALRGDLEVLRPIAKKKFREFAYATQLAVEGSRRNLGMNRMMTVGEELIASHFQRKMDMSEEEFQDITRRAVETGSDEIVAASLDDLFGKVKADTALLESEDGNPMKVFYDSNGNEVLHELINGQWQRKQ